MPDSLVALLCTVAVITEYFSTSNSWWSCGVVVDSVRGICNWGMWEKFRVIWSRIVPLCRRLDCASKTINPPIQARPVYLTLKTKFIYLYKNYTQPLPPSLTDKTYASTNCHSIIPTLNSIAQTAYMRDRGITVLHSICTASNIRSLWLGRWTGSWCMCGGGGKLCK